MEFDHILLIGFGAPSRPEDVPQYLEAFAARASIPPARLAGVLKQYEAIGGSSPYNQAVNAFADEFQKALRGKGVNVPVFVGMRNWNPFLKDTLAEVKRRGLKKGLAIVLAPHRSLASFGKYEEALAEADFLTGGGAEYAHVSPWHMHPLFIEAHTAAIHRALENTSARRADTRLLFCAHSIPEHMARASRYEEEIKESAALAAQAAGGASWSVAFHSRSGKPGDAWTGPDVQSALAAAAGEGVKAALLVPIGFLCDNAEILYDLDIEARRAAVAAGLEFLRAPTVLSDARIARMFAELAAAYRG